MLYANFCLDNSGLIYGIFIFADAEIEWHTFLLFYGIPVLLIFRMDCFDLLNFTILHYYYFCIDYFVI